MLVALWVSEDFITTEVQDVIDSGSLHFMYACLEVNQDNIFVKTGYCRDVTKLWDCSLADLRNNIFPGFYDIKIVIAGWIIELFCECSGMGKAPLKKFFFTGW